MQELLREKQSASAIRKLLFWSLAIIGLPLSSLFLSKSAFEKYFDYNSGDSVTYAAIVAVVVIHIVLIGFIYVAWTEDDKQQIVFQPSNQKQD